MRRLFNQRRIKAHRAHVVAQLAEVAGAGGGDLAPAAQGALAALDAHAESAAAAEDAEDAEDAELYTAHSSPEAAASPQTPIRAPTAEDADELDTLRTPRGLTNAFLQAATRSPYRMPPVSHAHLSLTPAAATPPLDPVPSPALQSTAQPPQPSNFAYHPLANDAHLERVAQHAAVMPAHGKNDKRKHTAAEKAAGKAVVEEIKKRKKQAGESTSAPSHAAQANAANILAAKDLATSKAALAKAEAALAKEEAAIRKVTLAAVCAYLIFGDYAPCSQ